MRLVTLLALIAVAAGCADPAAEPPPAAPTPPPLAEAPPLPAAPADTASGEVPAPPALAPPPASEASPPPAAEEPPAAPAPAPRPAPPARPEAARTEAADAFWASLQSAIRRGDRAALEAALADVVTVGDVEYRRGSPQVQSVLDQIVENEQVRDAYLDAGRLVHGPEESAFSSVARVETPEGDVTRARLSGAVREVAPGTWRLVRLRTDPVD